MQVALAFAPLSLAWRLLDANRTNTLFLDDWSYVPLYEKAVAGHITLHDLFGGYLEHRPAIIRLINIGLMHLSNGDVSWQCVVSFAAVALTWLMCGWLLRRALGPWDRIWMPWAFMAWILFCPVQWQGFLWPACMLVNLPLMFLVAGVLLLGSARVPLWLRFVGCAFCAWLATYSYTPGLTLWVLLPLAAACGCGVPEVSHRRRFLLAWLVPMAVVVFCYFHGLENEVEPVFAYGQGKGDTASHSIATVLHSPDKGIKFALTLLGGNFARGILGPRWDLALYFGIAVMLLFVLGGCAWFAAWRRTGIRQAALPFVLVALSGVLIAGMVAAGRAWASKDVGGALNNRYACYACALAAGLVGMFAVLRRRAEDELETKTPFATRAQACISALVRPAVGMLCGLLVVNWYYGAEMMESWHYARLRGAVDLHFTPLLGQQQDRGRPGVHVRLAAERAAILNRLGLLDRPQAQTLNLDQFALKRRLDDKLARLTGTDRKPDRIEVSGYALLTMHGRPPDAVLLTIRSDSSPVRTIVDVTLPDVLPAFLLLNNLKDNQFIFDDFRPRRCGQWVARVKRDQIPKGKARIEAWALNFEQATVAEIGDGVTVD